MYRGLLLARGFLETLIAGVLVAVGCQLPHADVVDQSFGRVGQMTQSAEKQVQLMRGQVDEVRQKDFPKIARQLRSQTDTVSATVRASTIDFATVEAMSQALAAAAAGLEAWSATLDPQKCLPAADGLGTIADLLDGQGEFDARGLDDNCVQLINLRQRPPDASTNYELAITLLRITETSQSLQRLLQGNGFTNARSTLLELERSIQSAIDQIDVLSESRYPFVSAVGVEMRPVWPDGAQTAERLRTMLKDIKEIRRELDGAASLITPLVRSFEMPLQVLAQQSERGLAARPSATARLGELAARLRKTQHGLESTARAWPALLDTMHRSAVVLNGSRKQLDTVLAQRDQYERAVSGSEQITQGAEDILESYSAKLEVHLGDQERSLGQMESGLHQVSETLPEVKQRTNSLLSVGRWTFWLVGGLLGLHGLLLGFESRFRRASAAGGVAR